MHGIMTKRSILASTIIGLMVLAGFGALTAHAHDEEANIISFYDQSSIASHHKYTISTF